MMKKHTRRVDAIWLLQVDSRNTQGRSQVAAYKTIANNPTPTVARNPYAGERIEQTSMNDRLLV